jgi:acyl-CoA synthetase (AMP-forming)/AMP-acid ligase II
VVGQGYRLTETTAGVAFPDGVTATVPGSAGRVGPNTEVIAADPVTGASLGTGAEGELHVRGPQVMAGCRDRPDATAAAFAPGGWLRTGDLGRVDAEGNVFVVDRLKELIKVDALQVAPAELEALLAEHPAVADAAVVPRADARHGQVPVAVVVPAGPLDDDALLAWAAARVAAYERPRAVHRVDAIPRTPGGKILRRELAVRLAG